MHLDASREDTFDTFNEAYGNGETRKCIWRWRDADGGSIVAVTNAPRNTASTTIPYSRAPYVSPVKSGTDLPLVDFGSPNTCATDASPSNCWLRLIPDCSGVREIFYVAEHTVPAGDASANSGSILGGFNEYNLVGWGRYRIFTRDACLAAKQAEITVNGAPATTARVFPTRYNGDNLGAFCVVGISFPSEVSFSAIASGRNTPSATGGYRVGEIVA